MNAETREGVVAVLRNLVGELRAQTFDESDTRDPVSPNYRVGWNDRTRSIAKRIDAMIGQLAPRSAGPFAVVRAIDDFTLSTWETLGAATSACRNFVHEGVNCYVARDVSRGDTGHPFDASDRAAESICSACHQTLRVTGKFPPCDTCRPPRDRMIGRDGKVWP